MVAGGKLEKLEPPSFLLEGVFVNQTVVRV
jgi:hypothetical protein